MGNFESVCGGIQKYDIHISIQLTPIQKLKYIFKNALLMLAVFKKFLALLVYEENQTQLVISPMHA